LRSELTVTNVLNKTAKVTRWIILRTKFWTKTICTVSSRGDVAQNEKKLTAQLCANTKTLATSISDGSYIECARRRFFGVSISSMVLLFIIYYPHCTGFLFDWICYFYYLILLSFWLRITDLNRNDLHIISSLYAGFFKFSETL